MVSFCKPTPTMFRNSSQQIKEMQLEQLYNTTFNLSELFIGIKLIGSNNKFVRIFNLTDEEQNQSEIYFEKTVSKWMTCYHIKYRHSKKLKHKQGEIYFFELYHKNDGYLHENVNNYPYI